MNKVYVGNLSYGVTDDQLADAFAQFGTVTSATVIMDKRTGRSKGFGFVEFEDAAAVQAAISGMDGQEIDGRPVKVAEARPMEERN